MKATVTDDSILEEIWATRREIWRECGENWDNYFTLIKAAEAEHPERIVGDAELELVRQKNRHKQPLFATGQLRTAKAEAKPERAKASRAKRSTTISKEKKGATRS